MQQDLRATAVSPESFNVRLNAAHDEVIAEIKHERRVAQEISRGRYGVSDPQRSILSDERRRGSKLRSITDRRRHLLARITDNNANVRDSCVNELLDRIEDDRLICDRDELLGVRVGKWPEAAPFPAAEDKPL